MDQAELDVQNAQTALDNTTLHAPGAGTVTAIGGTGFITITNMTDLVVDTSIAEIDVSKVKAGQKATPTAKGKVVPSRSAGTCCSSVSSSPSPEC